MSQGNHRVLTLIALAALMVAGCEDKKSTEPEDLDPTQVMPDFAIQDVNPSSKTHGETVSPRQHLGGISCWYFGQAT